jgi:putative transposase
LALSDGLIGRAGLQSRRYARKDGALAPEAEMARPRHRTQPGATYFVTTNSWQRHALFHNSQCAALLEGAIFRYRDRGDYFVHRHVIMPDHIHLILTPGASTTLEKALMLIKGGSSHEIGKQCGNRLPVWQPGFAEHQIRDTTDFERHVEYIDRNPVRAGLAASPDAYPYGSAAGRYALDIWPIASGAKAHVASNLTAGLKPRPSILR